MLCPASHQLNRSIVRLKVIVGQRHVENGEENAGKTQLAGDVHAAEFHVHGDQFHRSDAALFDRLNEMIEIVERRSGTPETKTRHVGHVPRLRGARGRSVDDAGVRQTRLQVEHGETRLR